MGQRHVENDPNSGKSEREYEHSSGDRNTKKDEKDWKGFSGGAQRDATPSAPGASEPKDTDRH